MKALESPPDIDSFSVLERWLLRVTHNTAIDLLLRRKRQDASHAAEDLDMIIDPTTEVDSGDTARVSLQTMSWVCPCIS